MIRTLSSMFVHKIQIEGESNNVKERDENKTNIRQQMNEDDEEYQKQQLVSIKEGQRQVQMTNKKLQAEKRYKNQQQHTYTRSMDYDNVHGDYETDCDNDTKEAYESDVHMNRYRIQSTAPVENSNVSSRLNGGFVYESELENSILAIDNECVDFHHFSPTYSTGSVKISSSEESLTNADTDESDDQGDDRVLSRNRLLSSSPVIQLGNPRKTFPMHATVNDENRHYLMSKSAPNEYKSEKSNTIHETAHQTLQSSDEGSSGIYGKCVTNSINYCHRRRLAIGSCRMIRKWLILLGMTTYVGWSLLYTTTATKSTLTMLTSHHQLQEEAEEISSEFDSEDINPSEDGDRNLFGMPKIFNSEATTGSKGSGTVDATTVKSTSSSRREDPFHTFSGFKAKKFDEYFVGPREVDDHSSLSLADMHKNAYHTSKLQDIDTIQFTLKRQKLKRKDTWQYKLPKQQPAHLMLDYIPSTTSSSSSAQNWKMWPFTPSAESASSGITTGTSFSSAEQRRVDMPNFKEDDNNTHRVSSTHADARHDEALLHQDTDVHIGVNNNVNSNSEVKVLASELLQGQCPSYLIAFVINATDVKDECDGLVRAFEYKCIEQKPLEATSSYEHDNNDATRKTTADVAPHSSNNSPTGKTSEFSNQESNAIKITKPPSTEKQSKKHQERLLLMSEHETGGTVSDTDKFYDQSFTNQNDDLHCPVRRKMVRPFEEKIQLKYILLRLRVLSFQTTKRIRNACKPILSSIFHDVDRDNAFDKSVSDYGSTSDVNEELRNGGFDVSAQIDDVEDTSGYNSVVAETWNDVEYIVQNGFEAILYQDTQFQIERDVCALHQRKEKVDFEGSDSDDYSTLAKYLRDNKKLFAKTQLQRSTNVAHRGLLKEAIHSDDEEEEHPEIVTHNKDSDIDKGENRTNEKSEGSEPEEKNQHDNPTPEHHANAKGTSGNRTKATPLRIPTKLLHITEQTAVDTLSLHQGDSGIQAVAVERKASHENTTDPHLMSVQEKEEQIDTPSVEGNDNATDIGSSVNDPPSGETRACCVAILNAYHETCNNDEEQDISDSRLFFCVAIMALCGVVKSLIRYFKILWLPEAAGCILVGVVGGYIITYLPHHDVSFDGNWFLRILVPPIIFEAALSIDKRSFNRHIVPIIIYSVAGTIVATCLTAMILHYGTRILSPWCMIIPFVEALTFGALISSIDPIAVLSVLSNMGMNDTDTIYVLIFGESLLNDGVAIVLFHTLVHFLDENLIIDQVAINQAAIHFFVVAIGSLLIGVAAGMMSTVYFWMFQGCQTPLVEVIMFFCWALFPYYICDGIGWSGIVAAVAVGFFMDVYVVGRHRHHHHLKVAADHISTDCDDTSMSHASMESSYKDLPKRDHSKRRIFGPKGHLSVEARMHIGFVTEIISTMMETAIFAYLGFFLFSHRYHWNFWHIATAILACCLSRAVMIPSLGLVSNWITRFQQIRHKFTLACTERAGRSSSKPDYRGVVIDKNMQIALWFAGLRGAMSFALVEHIPLYDEASGRGTRLKPELKAMTSASIMFTVFILGGYTYYMMQHLGIQPQANRGKRDHGAHNNEHPPLEIMTLIPKHVTSPDGNDVELEDDYNSNDGDHVDMFHYANGADTNNTSSQTPKAVRRQRSVPVKRDELIDL